MEYFCPGKEIQKSIKKVSKNPKQYPDFLWTHLGVPFLKRFEIFKKLLFLFLKNYLAFSIISYNSYAIYVLQV